MADKGLNDSKMANAENSGVYSPRYTWKKVQRMVFSKIRSFSEQKSIDCVPSISVIYKQRRRDYIIYRE